MIDRRSLMLIGLAAAGTATLPGVAHAAGPSIAEQTQRHAARRFARAVVEALTAQQRAQAMLRYPARTTVPAATPAVLAREMAEDFRSGAVLKVRGCLLSETEVAWCLRLDREGASA